MQTPTLLSPRSDHLPKYTSGQANQKSEAKGAHTGPPSRQNGAGGETGSPGQRGPLHTSEFLDSSTRYGQVADPVPLTGIGPM